MKILLVYPVPPRTHWPVGMMLPRWVPTGLAYLAAALRRAGHEVRIHVREEHLARTRYDWDAAEKILKDMLCRFRPEMVGLSVLSPALAETETVAAWAKELVGPHVLTVAGNVHPTALPEGTLRSCPSLDAVVLGEGEHTIVELADHGLRSQTPGLAYRQDGRVVRTAPRAVEHDLDSLGPPALDLLDMPWYAAPSPWLLRYLNLSTVNLRAGRGCPNRCGFCAGPLVSGMGVRTHSVDYVMDQVLHAVENHSVQAIHFEDDTLGTDRNWLMELCERFGRQGLAGRIRWDCCLRANQADAEMLSAMKAAGCVQVEYGFECGYDAGLRAVNKNTTVEINRRAVRLTRQAGLRIFADILFGLPGETERQFAQTVEFIRWARPEIVSHARVCPLPGSDFYRMLPGEVRETINWADFAYMNLPNPQLNLSAMSVERFHELYRRFMKYLATPQVTWALLRDDQSKTLPQRPALRKRLTSFVLRHPIRASRVPW